MRKVHVSFDPFVKSSAAPFLGTISTKKVLEASPKLVVSKQLQSRGGAAAAAAKLTFADESKLDLDLLKLDAAAVVEKIELENGRVAAAEQKRGKPFS